MMQYFIFPVGMPPYNSFPVEVSRASFVLLCEELYNADGVFVTTDIETMYDTVVEKWFVSYLDHGKETIASCFGYTRAPVGDPDLYEE